MILTSPLNLTNKICLGCLYNRVLGANFFFLRLHNNNLPEPYGPRSALYISSWKLAIYRGHSVGVFRGTVQPNGRAVDFRLLNMNAASGIIAFTAGTDPLPLPELPPLVPKI